MIAAQSSSPTAVPPSVMKLHVATLIISTIGRNNNNIVAADKLAAAF